MNLMDVLQGQLSDDLIGQLSEHIGATPEQTAQASNGIFATMLGGLANQATSENGLTGIADLLDRDNDGSVLDDLFGMVGGMIGGGNDNQPAQDGGMGILGTILGGQQETAAAHIGQSSGLSVSQVMKLMPILAPILMNVLGKTKNAGGLDLGGLAGILMGSTQQAQQQPGIGDLLGNVLGGVFGGNQQPEQQQQPTMDTGSMADILGGIFGKR